MGAERPNHDIMPNSLVRKPPLHNVPGNSIVFNVPYRNNVSSGRPGRGAGIQPNLFAIAKGA